MTTPISREDEHEEVYGKSFSLYNLAEVRTFSQFLSRRFVANDIDPISVFQGKSCLDAGCGNGRGSLFMLENGAQRVTAVDISESNVQATKQNCQSAGFTNVVVSLENLDSLPYDTNSFDFVWCNGVLMHTERPSACLAEITRVLRVGGSAWIYVYGEGGIYWYLIHSIREALADLEASQVLATLRLMGLETRYVGEYIDDWKVPYLRAYRPDRFEEVLVELGYNDPERLMRGVDYDTSDRLSRHPADTCWLGSGDLRYFLTKASVSSPKPDSWPDLDIPTESNWSREILETFGPLAERLKACVKSNRNLGLMACARVQRQLRDLLSVPGDFQSTKFQTDFSETLDLTESLLGD